MSDANVTNAESPWKGRRYEQSALYGAIALAIFAAAMLVGSCVWIIVDSTRDPLDDPYLRDYYDRICDDFDVRGAERPPRYVEGMTASQRATADQIWRHCNPSPE